MGTSCDNSGCLIKGIETEELNYAKQTDKAVGYFSEKLGFTISCTRLKEKMDRGDRDFQLLDVRHKEAYDEGRIPGAIMLDADNLDKNWHLFSKDKLNIVYCYGMLCHKGYQVCLEAAKRGYPVMDLWGNFDGWENYPMKVER